ncbi:MAG: polyprenyl synthetase family protein [Erysipelotrichia bacterium]|jgi:geranylgeranyl diphosphate synthase type II|nr:polyprenyl synthetase family protein [Erysipelotrichia bacterium]
MKHLVDLTFKHEHPSSVLESALYTLNAPSKLIRYQLVHTLCEDLGLCETHANLFGLALECVHAYSLIHDDLPSMDNDTIRRNQPTNHLVYGEATALLAGDGLLTKAFDLIAHSGYNDHVKVELIKLLSRKAGLSGMILGQQLDMEFEKQDITMDDYVKMSALKTGQLFAAALMGAAIISNDETRLSHYQVLGENFGVAFQIQDDLLEVTSDAQSIGKSLSDANNNKKTCVTIIGVEASIAYLNDLFDDIEQQFSYLGLVGSKTHQLIESLKARKK